MGAVPSVSAEHFENELAVPLPRYAQIVDYSEAAFFGVNRDGQTEYACRTIWTMAQRRAIARALMNAQGEFWKYTNYPMVPTYITAERHDYDPRLVLLNNCNILGLGQRAETVLFDGLAVSHLTDPVVITFPVTFADAGEIKVYHPGTAYEIIPSELEIASGTAIIKIPRVRMVALAYDDNPSNGWDYTDLSHFEAAVDIHRVYLDTTNKIQVFGHEDCETWASFWNDGYLRRPPIGQVRMATRPQTSCNIDGHYMDVYYLCGLRSLSVHAEDAIVRLAHARMTNEPCGCNSLLSRWSQDRRVPEILTSERENCRFGMSDGAWQAWTFLQNMICYRGRAL